MRKLLLLLAILLGPVCGLVAQTTKTSLSGRITTAQGAVISGASVVVTLMSTETVYGCASNTTGRYFIPDIRPGGPYQIEVSYLGFQKFLIPAVFLKLDEPLVTDIVLQDRINSLPEISIRAARTDALIRSATSGPAFHFGKEDIRLLPSVKRGIADFVKLSPLVYGSAIAGGNYRQNFITIDGSEFNNNFGVGDNLPGNGSQPIALDAIAELSVNIAPYHSIWESGFIGSAVNIISRSGSNKAEGSVYTYFRNQDDYGYQAGDRMVDKRPVQYQLEGARLGGPLISNKLFYFLSFEQEKESYQPQPFQASTAQFPYGSNPNIARPTGQELDMISKYLLENYNYQTGPYQDYRFQNKSNKTLVRLDWNIGANNTFSIRYNQLHSSRPELLNGSRSPLTPYSASLGRRSVNALPFSNSNFNTISNFYSMSAEWNNKLNDQVKHTLRASYTRQYEPRTSDSRLFPFVDILKDGLPFTSFGYEPFTNNNKRDVNVISLMDYLHWNVRKGTWAAGFQTDYSKTKNGYMPFGTGYYTFASWQDFTGGKKPLDYALTYPLNSGSELPEYSFDYLNASVFFQHHLSIGDRLSITGGLRTDLPLFPKALPQNEALSKLRFSGGQQINTSQLPRPALLFAPRLAVRYDLTKDKSMRIRGGTGIFTGRIPFVWIISQARYSGVDQVTQTWQGQSNTPQAFDPVYPQKTILPASMALPSVSSMLSRDFKMPQSWKSSLGLDMLLPFGFKGTLEAIYNRDIRGILFRDANLVEPVALNIPGYPDHRMVYPARNSDKFINPLNTSGQADPDGSSALNMVVISNSSKGYYFSALAQVEKQFAKSLKFSIAYSRSSARNYNDGDGDQTLSALNATPSVNGINNPVTGYAGYVPPHRIVSMLTYAARYGKILKFNVGLVYQGATEGRFSYTYSKDLIGDGTNKSLIYIPSNPSEIKFEPLSMVINNQTVSYSPEQQSSAFFNYIAQDRYLSQRKGKYAERNAALLPWRNQVDLRFSNDFVLNTKQKQHTLQLSIDILNIGNMINHQWGLRKIVNTTAILSPVNLEQVRPNGTVSPAFQLATIGGKLITNTFRTDYSTNSTYLMQFGIRYLFE
jgi:hypothetical protein